MNKKLLVFWIASLFLLVSCASFSAVGQKVEVIEQSKTTGDDLPDLTIELEITKSGILEYSIHTIIRNEGTGTVPAGGRLTMYIRQPEWRMYAQSVPITEPIKPGDTREHQGWTTEKLAGKEITAIVDPPDGPWYPWPEYNPDPVYGLIIESNEDNNIDTVIAPTITSYNSFSLLQQTLTTLSTAMTSATATSTTR